MGQQERYLDGYTHHGACVMRTPILPFRTLCGGIDRGTLRQLFANPVVREALYLASPSLDSAVDAWLEDPDAPRAHDVEMVASRYIARMSFRPTPFGLFAGCSVARIGETSSLMIGRADECTRRSRLDMHYLAALGEVLEADRHVRDVLRFRRNSSLSLSDAELRYVEGRDSAVSRARDFRLVAVESTAPLVTALAVATKPVPLSEIRDAIVGHHPRVSPTRSERFIHELIDTQILESNLRPTVTCDEPLDRFVRALGTGDGTRLVVETLTEVQGGLRDIDARGIGNGRESYRALLGALERLPIVIDPARVFQVDVFRPSPELCVGERVIRDVRRAVTLLHRITPARGTPAMVRFQERFAQRYGDREVPLVEALDEERGLGFDAPDIDTIDPSSLLVGIDFPSFSNETSVSMHERYKLQRLLALRESGQSEWSLDEDDLEALAVVDPAPLPDALAAMVTLAARSNDALDRGDFELLVHHVSGPSGAPLLARFCHGDPAIRLLVETHLREEEACRPDSVFAEVVHLPAGRLGNVICRPILRAHEIPYLGTSGAPLDKQIAIEDLRVSVRDRKVRLRSAKLNREVIPRLSSAHTYWSSTLSIYRFLGAVQQEGLACPLRWRWGDLLQDAPFLPRVRYGNIVLSLARWAIPTKDVIRIALDSLARARLGLPRWVCVVEGDNFLPIDLESPSSAKQLLASARGLDYLRLHELFPKPELMCVTSHEGVHEHELIVPFARKPDAPSSRRPFTIISGRSYGFIPGSEWLYAKIYTGPATADLVLRNAIAPLVRELVAAKCVEVWFFIRYADPEPHLRIRFRGSPDRLFRDVLPLLNTRIAPLLVSGHVARVQLDTYQPEIERYGGPKAISLSEQIFTADSDAALAIIERTTGDAGADARWKAALYGMHMFLDDANIDDETRRAFVVRVRDVFVAEHRMGTAGRRSLSARYRAERATVERLLAGALEGDEGFEPLLSIIRARSARLTPVFADLRALHEAGELEASWDDVLRSFLHMHVNRVIRENQRKHEMVLYEFLLRAYESAAARARISRSHRPGPR